ncbi:PaeR7I family type II restriction endonuclease [Streptomyces albus]|uniref:PaeR7I family type II restriction endonuclease n=1 Tax=Streptomyces albus TaxID=1888 RepID=UPI0004CC6846|nr:PaeR7I family type II restriction endonuclease [Streptomyces albus]
MTVTVTRQEFEEAAASHWYAKRLQKEQPADQGAAESVHCRKHLDSITGLLSRFFLNVGYPPESIRVTPSQGLELPGYYTPQKQWDLVIVHEGVLVAAFELKAVDGPTDGDNYNTRAREALGSAVDLHRAALAELFPREKPWLGYFFIMQDGEKCSAPVRIAQGALPVDDVWHGTSYQDRFGIFCRRLLDESLYDAVCYVTSSAGTPRPVEPVESLDWRHFAAAINGRLAYLKSLGIPG